MADLQQRMIRAAKLDIELFREVASDTTATGQAAAVVVISGIAAGLGSMEAVGGFVGVGKITILGATTAPGTKGTQAEQKWPVFWTVQHPAGENTAGGRVFCAVIGHFNTTTNDPLLRTIHLRAIAWCLNEPFGLFKPLVLD